MNIRLLELLSYLSLNPINPKNSSNSNNSIMRRRGTNYFGLKKNTSLRFVHINVKAHKSQRTETLTSGLRHFFWFAEQFRVDGNPAALEALEPQIVFPVVTERSGELALSSTPICSCCLTLHLADSVLTERYGAAICADKSFCFFWKRYMFL